MNEIERLQKQWRDSARFRGLHASMSLEKEGLVLGAGTILAKRGDDCVLELAGEETRILTLLAVAYGQPIKPSALDTIRHASKHARAGDECMAAMHVALAQLPKLADPADAARRLFIADGLIEAGVQPRDIWRALEFDTAALDEIEKGFNPDEPRNPAGDGIVSGRWTSLGEAAEEVASDVISTVGRAARRALPWAVPGIDVADTFVSMTSAASPAPRSGDVPGHPDLQYVLDEDALSLRIYRPPYPAPILEARAGTAGTYVDRRGRKIARLEATALRFFARALSQSISEHDTLQICPTEAPDRPGAKGLNLDYEDYIKAQNNDPPTRRGFGYWLLNPIDKRPVVVDDCRRSTNTPIEIKRGYDGFMSSFWGRGAMAIDWGYQATRQAQAWSGPEIEWDFSNKDAAQWAESVFRDTPWLGKVHAEWKPWKGHKDDQ
jgi:hypothetical protein